MNGGGRGLEIVVTSIMDDLLLTSCRLHNTQGSQATSLVIRYNANKVKNQGTGWLFMLIICAQST